MCWHEKQEKAMFQKEGLFSGVKCCCKVKLKKDGEDLFQKSFSKEMETEASLKRGNRCMHTPTPAPTFKVGQ